MNTKVLIALITLATLISMGASDAVARNIDEYERILSGESLEWLLPINTCPATLVTDKAVSVTLDYGYCDTHLAQCVIECKQGDPERCLLAAQAHQNLDKTAHALGFFQKACSLGAALACTNFAANVRYRGLADQQCYAPVFEKTCEQEEPWGCAMTAAMYVYAEGVEANKEKASVAAELACTLSPDSEPCDFAKQVIESSVH